MADGKVVVSPLFEPGTKVELRDRTGDGIGDVIKTGTVDKESALEFTGLEPDRPYWVTDGQVRVAATARAPKSGPSKPGPSEREDVRKAQTRAALELGNPGVLVEGNRSTVTAKPDTDEAAKKRSEASRKAAATRKRNAAKKSKK